MPISIVHIADALGSPLSGVELTWSDGVGAHAGLVVDALTGATRAGPQFVDLGDGAYQIEMPRRCAGWIDATTAASPRYLAVTYEDGDRVTIPAINTAGVPLAGLAPSWLSLLNAETGAAYTPQPGFTALTIAGLYAFTPSTTPLEGWVDCGASASPRYIGYSSGTIYGWAVSNATTTYAAIRDNMIAKLEAIAPTMVSDISFRRSRRNVPLRDWKRGNASSALLRRFEFIRGQSPDSISQLDPAQILRQETVTLTVSYPTLFAKYGLNEIDDVENVIRQDARSIRDALYSANNYVPGQQAAFVTIDATDRADPDAWFQDFSITILFYEAQNLAAL